MNPTRSRGIILNKIKQALSKKKNNLQEPDFSSPVFAESTEKDLSILFAENFVNVRGEFIFCESAGEFSHALPLLARKKNLKNIYAWNRELLPLLEQSKLKFRTTDEGFSKADAGITTCESLVSRTGSILITSAGSGRKLDVFPATHIVVAYTSQIVYDIGEALAKVRKKYEGKLPSMISLVSGPSRTADIEKTVVIGAHGPKEIILFLIDDHSY